MKHGIIYKAGCATGRFTAFLALGAGSLWAGQAGGAGTPAKEKDRKPAFELGQFVTVTTQSEEEPGVAGSVITSEQIRTFNKGTLDQAVNLAPGVSSTLDANGRRNESDIFVRGFGRWQVPLMVDGVRIYLPADNRLDFARFLTNDIASIQIEKGFASVLDGPGAMGGAINLVTRKPVKPFEAEGGISVSGRKTSEAWDSYVMLGTRQKRFYLQGSGSFLDRDFWTLPGEYTPTPTSLQPSSQRTGSDNRDWRINFKAGYTPNAKNEYVINFTKQAGEKGAPLNVYTNPPVPANAYWRWPWWNTESLSLLSTTALDSTSYVKTKLYYNNFRNGLYAYDTAAYATQSNNGRFQSLYDDYAAGGSVEIGTTRVAKHAAKGAFFYRSDFHSEFQINRPTHPTLSTTEPKQRQQQRTWSIALEDTYSPRPHVDLVGGISYEKFEISRAEEYNTTLGLYQYPLGGSDSLNWQAAMIWKYSETGRIHASISDRTRFPVIFELYSTRFGTATPNPNLGPERATNFEIGWKRLFHANTSVSGALFLSDVRDLVQTIVLPDTTTQTQNVGNGHFYGLEFSAETTPRKWVSGGLNYTYIRRIIRDALVPLLRPTGVPTQKASLYTTLRPVKDLAITPSVEFADERWSDFSTSPVQPFPYIKTGAYTLVNLDLTHTLKRNFQLSIGAKNLFDDYYELGWGLPQPGRTFYLRGRTTF